MHKEEFYTCPGAATREMALAHFLGFQRLSFPHTSEIRSDPSYITKLSVGLVIPFRQFLGPH